MRSRWERTPPGVSQRRLLLGLFGCSLSTPDKGEVLMLEEH